MLSILGAGQAINASEPCTYFNSSKQAKMPLSCYLLTRSRSCFKCAFGKNNFKLSDWKNCKGDNDCQKNGKENLRWCTNLAYNDGNSNSKKIAINICKQMKADTKKLPFGFWFFCLNQRYGSTEIPWMCGWWGMPALAQRKFVKSNLAPTPPGATT